MSADPKLIAALITARAAIDGALLALTEKKDETAEAEPITPGNADPDTCRHKNWQKSFGGHGWCPDCGLTK